MTCQELDVQLSDYLAGTLASDAALRLESHAASCARCDARVERATRLPVNAFAPAPPPSLRARTLAAVALRRGGVTHERARALSEAERAAPQRWARWWSGGAMLAAAAALVFVSTSPRSTQVPPLLADSSGVVTTMPKAGESIAVDAAALAESRSMPEFLALEHATDELRAALVESPDDAELRALLASVTARRDELARRVKDAAS